MALTSSMEDYLEAVLILHQKHGSVRGVDIAVHLGVTKPSVSRAVKELSKSGYIVKIPMAHSPSQIQACKSLHRFMRNTFFHQAAYRSRSAGGHCEKGRLQAGTRYQ